MAVRLETTIKRYIGLSTDERPTDAQPFGSSLLESDTGRIWKYGIEGWTLPIIEDEQVQLLSALVVEVLRIGRLLTLATGVDVEENAE